MVRFVNPDAEVRLAGGREIHLRSLQPLALHVVNSIFLGDYLTSEGQPGAADLAMIADAGFEVTGAHPSAVAGAPDAVEPPSAEPAAPALVAGRAAPLTPATPRPDLVHIRHRGPGTTLPANS
jgi:biotin synthase